MFKDNKYSRIYFNIINSAKSNKRTGYTENHHIIPKSLGGSNEAENIVTLTAREHFVCHRLLVKMVSGSDKYKMTYAAWQLSRPSKYKHIKISSHTYESLRIDLSESMKGRKRKPFNEEWKLNMSQSAKTRKYSMTEKRKAHILKMVSERADQSGSNNPFYGRTHTPEVSKMLSKKNVEVFTGVPKTRCSCIFCLKEVTVNTLHYHKKCVPKSGVTINKMFIPTSNIDINIPADVEEVSL
jgi:hypothetical protein